MIITACASFWFVMLAVVRIILDIFYVIRPLTFVYTRCLVLGVRGSLRSHIDLSYDLSSPIELEFVLFMIFWAFTVCDLPTMLKYMLCLTLKMVCFRSPCKWGLSWLWNSELTENVAVDSLEMETRKRNVLAKHP